MNTTNPIQNSGNTPNADTVSIKVPVSSVRKTTSMVTAQSSAVSIRKASTFKESK